MPFLDPSVCAELLSNYGFRSVSVHLDRSNCLYMLRCYPVLPSSCPAFCLIFNTASYLSFFLEKSVVELGLNGRLLLLIPILWHVLLINFMLQQLFYTLVVFNRFSPFGSAMKATSQITCVASVGHEYYFGSWPSWLALVCIVELLLWSTSEMFSHWQ